MIEPSKIYVRFSDIDVMGHVNNAVYLNYFESARMDFFNALLGKDWDWVGNGIILLKNEIEYLRPVVLHDEPQIHLSVDNLGNKSFVLGYQLLVNGELYTRGKSTLVCFDYGRKITIEIPEKLRTVLTGLIVE
jgi:acyl-CoA thioester hydrolase